MLKETIFRCPKDKNNPYVMINKEFFSDKNISWKAKGLLGYLLSKPDDWVVVMQDLVNNSTDGEKAVRSGMKELIENKYMMRYPVYMGKTICRWETIYTEVPFTDNEIIKYKKVDQYDNVIDVIYINEVEVNGIVEVKEEDSLLNLLLSQNGKVVETLAKSLLSQNGKVVENQLNQALQLLSQNVLVENAGLLINDDTNITNTINQSINHTKIDSDGLIDKNFETFIADLKNEFNLTDEDFNICLKRMKGRKVTNPVRYLMQIIKNYKNIEDKLYKYDTGEVDSKKVQIGDRVYDIEKLEKSLLGRE